MSIEIDELRRLAVLRDVLLRKRNEFFEMRPTSKISDPAEKRFSGFVDVLLTAFDDSCSELHATFLDTSVSSDPAKDKIRKELFEGLLRGDDTEKLLENLSDVSRVDKNKIKTLLKSSEAVKIVAEEVFGRMEQASLEAMGVLEHALGDNKALVRLKAAESILNRAGYDSNKLIDLLREKEALRGREYTLDERRKILAKTMKMGERSGLRLVKDEEELDGTDS